MVHDVSEPPAHTPARVGTVPFQTVPVSMIAQTENTHRDKGNPDCKSPAA